MDPDCNATSPKQELRVAAEHCQMLAEKLCRNDLINKKAGLLPPPELELPPFVSEGECCSQQRLKNTAIVAENIKLRQVVKDVTEINKRWQKYNTQQKDYIQRLERTIGISQTGGEVPSLETSHVPFRQEEDRNKVYLSEATRTLDSLRKQNEELLKVNSRLEKMVEELRRDLERKDQDSIAAEKSKDLTSELELREAQEQAAICRMQAKMHKDDWEVEKIEKEEVKRKLWTAEEDVRDLASKCEVLEYRLRRIQAATLATMDMDDKKIRSSLEEDQAESPGSVSVGWNFKPSQTPVHGPVNGRQPRVLSRGPQRLPQRHFPSQDIVFCDVELDYSGPQSLTKRTSVSPEHQIFDTSSHSPISFLEEEDSTNSLVFRKNNQEQYLSDQQMLLSKSLRELQSLERTTSECLFSLK